MESGVAEVVTRSKGTLHILVVERNKERGLELVVMVRVNKAGRRGYRSGEEMNPMFLSLVFQLNVLIAIVIMTNSTDQSQFYTIKF